MMALPSDKALLLGLGAAGGVFAVHSNLTPSMADVRAALPGDRDASVSERTATGIGAGIAVGFGLLSRDPTVFVIAGTTVVAMAWAYRAANASDPRTGQLVEAPDVEQGMDVMEDAGVVAYV